MSYVAIDGPQFSVPERALWLSAIRYSFDQVARVGRTFAGLARLLSRSPNDDWARRVVIEMEEDVLFLTADRGAWAEARANVCGACGLDPDLLRQRALNVIASQGWDVDRIHNVITAVRLRRMRRASLLEEMVA